VSLPAVVLAVVVLLRVVAVYLLSRLADLLDHEEVSFAPRQARGRWPKRAFLPTRWLEVGSGGRWWSVAEV
jgi:hypothetical protein